MAVQFTVIVAVGVADFGPSPGSYELDSLFAQADAVCLGRVEHGADITSGQSGAVREVSRSFGLAVGRCYKGVVSPTDAIRHFIRHTTHIPGEHTTDVYLREGVDALVFLKEVSPHVFTFAFPFWGHLSDAWLGVLEPISGSGMDQLERDILASTQATA